ncbi:MAG: outer membrane beta-barrel protein, partial [Gemmatimonadota bacterium]|nr:outer membrane beta-barrel protein [Gemmatimonadota bacterium]
LPGGASAQGISAILDRLDRLEGQVAQLDRSRPGPVTVPPGSRATEADVTAIAERLTRLEERLETLAAPRERDAAGEVASLEEAVASLAAVVQGLVAWHAGPDTAAGAPESTEVQDASEVFPDGGETAASDPTQVATPGGVEISGFVDASYFHDRGSAATSTFGLDQVEVNIRRAIGSVGVVRADVEWVNDGAGGFALDVEQGFLQFNLPGNGGVTVSFGKFNAPIGFELLDPADMYQFSHALVFNHGLPTNLTGAMVAFPLGGRADLAAYVVNGWDQNTDVAAGKTYGGRLGMALAEGIALGVSAIVDGGDEAVDAVRVFDADLTVEAVEGWTLGAEVNHGVGRNAAYPQAWKGLLAMAHKDFSDRYGLTLRYDAFDDGEGTRLGTGAPEVRQAFAFAPTFVLGDGMGALIELRTDWSDHDVFETRDGAPSRSLVTLAFEMTYTF